MCRPPPARPHHRLALTRRRGQLLFLGDPRLEQACQRPVCLRAAPASRGQACGWLGQLGAEPRHCHQVGWLAQPGDGGWVAGSWCSLGLGMALGQLTACRTVCPGRPRHAPDRVSMTPRTVAMASLAEPTPGLVECSNPQSTTRADGLPVAAPIRCVRWRRQAAIVRHFPVALATLPAIISPVSESDRTVSESDRTAAASDKASYVHLARGNVLQTTLMLPIVRKRGRSLLPLHGSRVGPAPGHELHRDARAQSLAVHRPFRPLLDLLLPWLHQKVEGPFAGRAARRMTAGDRAGRPGDRLS